MCLNECRAHSLSHSQNKMECTLNPQSIIHKQRVVSSFAPTLTLTNVQCGRHPRSQSLEHRVEDTQTLSLTLSRTQNGCYTHSLTPHTHLLPLERLLSLSHKQWRTHSLKLTLNRSHAQRGHTPVSQSLSHTHTDGRAHSSHSHLSHAQSGGG